MTPTFAHPSTFLGVSNPDDAEICIAGICHDIGTTNRPGARFGPAAIRAASSMLISGGHPTHLVDPKQLNIADVGNFDIVNSDLLHTLDLIQRQAKEFKHLISLGGDHSISLPLLRALADKHGPVALVHFDAHMDTWPDNFGGIPYGHGNPFYHAINEKLVEPNRMIQIGIRSSVGRDVYEWTKQQRVTQLTAENILSTYMSPLQLANWIKSVVGNKPTYLTIDVDVLDPSFAPGTGTPEAGGLPTWLIMATLRKLTGVNFIGMDVVEVAPPYDVAEITALAAATFVWEYLSLLAIRRD